MLPLDSSPPVLTAVSANAKAAAYYNNGRQAQSTAPEPSLSSANDRCQKSLVLGVTLAKACDLVSFGQVVG